MYAYKTNCLCSCTILILPDYSFHMIFFSEYFIAEHDCRSHFIIIYTDKDYSIIGHQFSCYYKTPLHKRQPFTVLKAIFFDNYCIIITEFSTSSIIWRIYVPTDFDTKEKALSVAKAAEKGLK